MVVARNGTVYFRKKNIQLVPKPEATIKEFLRSFGGQWFTKMSGPLTVPFALAALFVPQAWLKIFFALLAIVCAAVSAYGVWAAERKTLIKSEMRLEEIELSKPRMRIRTPGAISVSNVSFNREGIVLFTAPFIRIRFINDPARPYPNAIAREIVAKIRFFTSESLLLEIDGRWADSDQPSLRDFRQSRNDLLKTEFAIGGEHDLDIAFRDPDTGACFAWNNDNYNYQDMRKPEHRMNGDLFRVEVRLRGPWVDESFTFQFRNASGGLEVL